MTQRNVVVGRQAAGHAGAPQQLVAHVPVDDLVDFGEFGDARLRVRVYAGDQLELRFAEIGGDMRVRERRAEPGGVRRVGEHSVLPYAQAFLFHAAPYASQHFARKHA